MNSNKHFFLLLITCFFFSTYAQCYWQQRVEYRMDIDFNVKNHQFSGVQTLIYYNNSPDTLFNVFYHLYFNAFQPGSMMDVRSRTLPDPDKRVRDRIFKLQKQEIGYQKINLISQNGKAVIFSIEGTVAEVLLNEPLLPGTSTEFYMEFKGQVPLQIRRCGRNNAEGIAYSMSQWYPKMAEYDNQGWHAHPYIGREFYAPWGDFEVNITLAQDYVVAGTGILQNPNEVGYGYEDEGVEVIRKSPKLTWKFKAENVHDFVWAADPDYVHTQIKVPKGPVLHFFFQQLPETEAWKELPGYAVKAFQFIEKNYGKYPYPHYSIIQGGDGGMEYPMATLITGERALKSLVSVTIHEALHSWFQGVLATNESYYAWMDEGFTTYATNQTMAYVFQDTGWSQKQTYQAYNYLTTIKEEPLSTHADHFETNAAYGIGSYHKGAIALAQMNYLVGKNATDRAMKKYFEQWKFKHPTANDWIRVFEKETHLELSWYLDYWINTTRTIDYEIDSVYAKKNNTTTIALKKVGKMPMPIEVYITQKDGTKTCYYAPLMILRGEKQNESNIKRITLPDWPWTHQTYNFETKIPFHEIESIIIDEEGYMADINKKNNSWYTK